MRVLTAWPPRTRRARRPALLVSPSHGLDTDDDQSVNPSLALWHPSEVLPATRRLYLVIVWLSSHLSDDALRLSD